MKVVELDDQTAEQIRMYLNGLDLAAFSVTVTPSARLDNSDPTRAFARLRDALNSKETFTDFNAVIALELLSRADGGAYALDHGLEPEKCRHAKLLKQRGMIVAHIDHHGVQVSRLEQKGRDLRDFLQWWHVQP